MTDLYGIHISYITPLTVVFIATAAAIYSLEHGLYHDLVK